MNKDKEFNQLNHGLHNHKHHHRSHRRKIIVRSIIGAAVALVAVSGVYVAYASHQLSQTSQAVYQSTNSTKLRNSGTQYSKDKPVSVLLLGTNTSNLSQGTKGQTDTVMIMTINPKSQKTTIASLPKNLAVNLPDYSQYSPAAISSAYTYGGTKETIDTLQDEFKAPIDNYLLLNVAGLKQSINAVGGVSVTSPTTFTSGGTAFTKGQTMLMNGATATKFASTVANDPQGEYGSQNRQMLVISALMKKSVTYKTVLNNKFLDSVSSEVKTDLTESEMADLALHYRSAGKHVTSDYVKGVDKEIGGQDFETISKTEQQSVSNELNTSLGLKDVSVTK